MNIDEEFEDERRRASSDLGGRRASDTPTVPLREHLETLLRGIDIRHEQEVSDLSRSLKEFLQECRESWGKTDDKLHKMKAEIAALRLLEEHRRGAKDQKTEQQSWVQWLPSLFAAAAAVYVAFFA